MIYHSVYWVSGQGALPLYWRDWNRAILSSLPFIVGRASDFQGREQYTHPADMQISVALLPRPIFPWNLSGQTAAGASHWPPACPPHFWIKKVSKGVVLLKNLEWVPLAWFFLDSQATVWYLRSMVDSHPGVGGGWRELYILPKAQPHRGVNVWIHQPALDLTSVLASSSLASICFSHLALAVLNYLQSP